MVRLAASMPPVVAEKLVPGALRFGAAVVVPAAFLAGFALAMLIRLLFARRIIAERWTERARATFPVRTALGVSSLVGFVATGVCSWITAPRIPGALPPVLVVAMSAIAGWLGTDVVRLAVERRAHGRAIAARGWFSWKPIVFLLYLVQLLPMGIGAASIHDRFDAHSWIVLGSVALAAIVVQTGVVWLALWAFGVVRPASMRLRAAIERASVRTGVEPRAIGILPTFGVPFANAFALPLLRRIAFTSDALAILDDEEIEAIAAHELGHVGEPRAVAIARLGRAAIFLPLVAARPLYGTLGLVGVALAFVAFLVLLRANVVLGRKMEERADRVAHLGGEAGPVYARALEKLYARNLVPAVMVGKRRSHPDLWDRMIAAGVKPSHPKPAPPRVRGVLVATFLVAYLAIFGLAIFDLWVQRIVEQGVAARFGSEAQKRLERGDAADAYTLYLSAIALDPAPAYHVGIAWAEATLDVCDEASDDMVIATTRKKASAGLDHAPFAEAERAIEECYRRRGEVDPTFQQDHVDP